MSQSIIAIQRHQHQNRLGSSFSFHRKRRDDAQSGVSVKVVSLACILTGRPRSRGFRFDCADVALQESRQTKIMAQLAVDSSSKGMQYYARGARRLRSQHCRSTCLGPISGDRVTMGSGGFQKVRRRTVILTHGNLCTF